MSTDPFSLYSENIMKSIIHNQRINVGGYISNNLCYIDDTALIAENVKNPQDMLTIVIKEREKKDLI